MALALVVLVALTTIGPVEFRIETGANAYVERFVAFLVTGAALVLGYGKRLVLVGAILLVTIAGLEIVQEFIPQRHGRFSDFFIKAAGFLIGVFAGRALARKLQQNRVEQRLMD